MTPTHTLIQLTDIHIDDECPVRDGVDTLAVLEHAFDTIADSGVTPSAILLTGDLTEHGSPGEYVRLRAAVERGTARIGAPALYAMGNHDERAQLRGALLGVQAGTEPLDYVTDLDGLRVVVLDSTVPRCASGEIDEAQREWLRDVLAQPAAAGTVLAMHHPPLPSPVPLMERIRLRGRDELAEVLAGTDVRMILAGHTHVAAAGMLAGIPVWSGGPIFTCIDALMPATLGDGLRTFATPSMSRIDVYPDTVMASSVPLTKPALELSASALGRRQ